MTTKTLTLEYFLAKTGTSLRQAAAAPAADEGPTRNEAIAIAQKHAEEETQAMEQIRILQKQKDDAEHAAQLAREKAETAAPEVEATNASTQK
jgi:hypothetical protein